MGSRELIGFEFNQILTLNDSVDQAQKTPGRKEPFGKGLHSTWYLSSLWLCASFFVKSTMNANERQG